MFMAGVQGFEPWNGGIRILLSRFKNQTVKYKSNSYKHNKHQ